MMRHYIKCSLRAILWLAVILALLGAFGCRYANGLFHPTATEVDYGRSVAHNQVEMMVHPPHGKASGPPVGLSPQAGANAQTMYEKSFAPEKKKKDPTAKPILVDISNQ